MRDVKLHAAQTQLVACHDTCAVAAAGGAYQPVRRSLRLAAAAQTADFDVRRLDEQSGIRRTAARTRNFERTREQRRFDSGQGPHLYRDSRDLVRTLVGGNFGYLGEQGLADGQLVHGIPRVKNSG
jgi:aminoglycoside N3'-acetyltransferase